MTVVWVLLILFAGAAVFAKRRPPCHGGATATWLVTRQMDGFEFSLGLESLPDQVAAVRFQIGYRIQAASCPSVLSWLKIDNAQ